MVICTDPNIIYGGKGTLLKNIQSLPTKDYIDSFINSLGTSKNLDISFWAKPHNLVYNFDGSLNTSNIVFSRVLVEVSLLQYTEWKPFVAMCYSLDTKVPCAKVYSGIKHTDTEGKQFQFINSNRDLYTFNLESKMIPNWNKAADIINVLSSPAKYAHVQNLANVYVKSRSKFNMLGKWIHNTIEMESRTPVGKVKISSADIVKGYEHLLNNDYFLKNEVPMFDIYKWMYNIVVDSNKTDLINICEKSLLLRRILEIK